MLSLIYLIGSVTFIIGLKMLSNPATARRGNAIAAGGMTLAILGTIFLYRHHGQGLHNYGWIMAGLLIGGVVGLVSAKRVKMTAMPEMVSLFNGMGGACAALISVVEFEYMTAVIFTGAPVRMQLVIILAGMVIGAVSFAGSVIAWGKLNGSIKDISLKGQHIFNLVILAVILLLAIVVTVALPAATVILFVVILLLSLL